MPQSKYKHQVLEEVDRAEEEPQVEMPQLVEEALQVGALHPVEEVHQEVVLRAEEHQGADLQAEDNHQHNKPKRHNQYPNKPDHDMNPYVVPK